MNFNKALLFCLILCSISNAGIAGEKDLKPCRENPLLSGPCFTVKGRLGFYNGVPSMRIWPLGTKRLLGISEVRFHVVGYANIPEQLAHQISWDSVMFADFTVCPFTDDKPGNMRMVCVDSADNISIMDRK